MTLRSKLAAAAWAILLCAGAFAESSTQFNIPAGDLVVAIELLEQQAAVELIFQADQLRGFQTRGVTGRFEPKDAIRMLIEGSPFELRIDPSGAMVIARSQGAKPGRSSAVDVDESKTARVPGTGRGKGSSARRPARRSTDTDTDEGLEEITVNANRRSQSIMDVGVSVTSLSQEDLHEYAITDATDIAMYAPGIVFNGGVGNNDDAYLSVRGVSQNDLAPHEESPNSIYMDGIYVASDQAATFATYDMERVEVLRGPQGTLFGRNATGGLMQFFTAEPTSVLSGFLTAEYGSFNDIKLEAAVSGPLTDSIRGRLATLVNSNDGWFRSDLPGQDNLFNTEFRGVRGELAVDLNDYWEALWILSYNNETNRGGAYRAVPGYVDQRGVSQFLPRNVDFYGTGPGANPFGYVSSADPYSGDLVDRGYTAKETATATLRVDGNFGDWTLESLSNYSLINDNYREDCLSQLVNACIYGKSTHQDQWSQELRLLGSRGPLQWSVGGYALGISGNFRTFFNTPAWDGTPDAVNLFSPFSQNTHSLAGYSQVEWALTEHLEAILGGRVTHDYKTFDSVAYETSGAVPVEVYRFDRQTQGDLAAQSLTNWQGKFELQYKPHDSTLVYASINRAIRAGGFNAVSTAIIPLDRTRFRSETNIAYEVGGKYRPANGHVYLSASAFYYDYHNYQALNFQALTPWVSNFPASSYGAELEASAVPAKGLTVALGGSYLQARIRGFLIGDVPTSVPPVMAPQFTAQGKIKKKWSVGRDSFSLQWDFSYMGRSNSSLIVSPVTTLPGSVLQNARASYTFTDRGVEVYAFANNLTNRAREIFAYDLISTFGTVDQTYHPPRWFGAGVRFSF